MNSNKKETYRIHTGTDPNGNPIYRVDVIPDPTPEPEPKPKEMSTAELLAEVERLYKKEFPKTETHKQEPNINQIKKFSKLLEDAANY
jgi:hypothetical protein